MMAITPPLSPSPLFPPPPPSVQLNLSTPSNCSGPQQMLLSQPPSTAVSRAASASYEATAHLNIRTPQSSDIGSRGSQVANALSSSSGGSSGQLLPPRRFSFTFEQGASLLQNPNAMLLPSHSPSQHSAASSTMQPLPSTSRNSSGGDSWSGNSMDLSSPAMFAPFQPVASPFASQYGMVQLGSPHQLSTPPYAAAGVGMHTPPELSALLAQASHGGLENNRALLQQRLDQLYHANQQQEQQLQFHMVQFQCMQRDRQTQQHQQQQQQQQQTPIEAMHALHLATSPHKYHAVKQEPGLALAQHAAFPFLSPSLASAGQGHGHSHPTVEAIHSSVASVQMNAIASPVQTILSSPMNQFRSLSEDALPPVVAAASAPFAPAASRSTRSSSCVKREASIASSSSSHSSTIISGRHLKSGSSPFECDECGKGFTQKGGLQNHLRCVRSRCLFPPLPASALLLLRR